MYVISPKKNSRNDSHGQISFANNDASKSIQRPLKLMCSLFIECNEDGLMLYEHKSAEENKKRIFFQESKNAKAEAEEFIFLRAATNAKIDDASS